MDAERPERAAALEYLRRKGTEAPVAKLAAGLRSAFQKFEQVVERVPPALRTGRPSPAAWSVHEIVDHLVETNRPALAELRQLCAGNSPPGGPIPARLQSANPPSRPWAELVDELKALHRAIVGVVVDAGDQAPVSARAPFVMVLKVPGPGAPEILEWVESVDWKAYAQALRVHTHEHGAQVERTVAALMPVPGGAASTTSLAVVDEGGRIVAGEPDQRLMSRAEDAHLVVEACLSNGASCVLLHAVNLPDAFFDLSSGVAGAVLQKLRNYRITMAVVCPPGAVRFSSRFGAMVAEERLKRQFGVFDSRDAALAWLRERRP
jgi:hypothetical protein